MFTGIIEKLGEIKFLKKNRGNTEVWIKSDLLDELKIDQSVSHNGVCLTVVEKGTDAYRVTAIEETLNKSSLADWKVGDMVNLERAMVPGARLDGHIVQGHVDQRGLCTRIKQVQGSYEYRFKYRPSENHLVVDKGSITINGVSLTVVDPMEDEFGVAIIPFTYEHTMFHSLKVGDSVNLEFDIIGKYIGQYLKRFGGTILSNILK